MAVPVAYDPTRPFDEVSDSPPNLSRPVAFDPSRGFDEVSDVPPATRALPAYDPTRPFDEVSDTPPPRAGRSLRFVGPPAATISNVSVNAPPGLAMPAPTNLIPSTAGPLPPTEADAGITEEVLGFGRALNRGGRRFVQSLDVTAMRQAPNAAEMPARSYADLKAEYDAGRKNIEVLAKKLGVTPTEADIWLSNLGSQVVLARHKEYLKKRGEKASESFSKQAAAIEKLPMTAAANEFFQKETPWWHFFKNPVELSTLTLAESAPIMAATVAAAPSGPVGMAAATGLSSWNAESSGRIVNAMTQDGVDLNDPKAVMGWFGDRAKSNPALAKADLAALGPATFDALTSGLAGRFLGPALGTGLRPVLTATGKEMGLQMAGGGAGTIAGSLLAQEPIDWKDFVLEVAAELAPLEAVSNVKAESRRMRLAGERKPNADQITGAVAEAGGAQAQNLPPVPGGASGAVQKPAGASPAEAEAQGPLPPTTPETLAGLTPQKGKLGRQGWMTSTDPAVRMSVQVNAGGILLNSIEAVQPGTGAVTAAIRRLMTLADATGKPLTLTAEALSKEKQDGLESFYERLGFKRTGEGEFLYQPTLKEVIPDEKVQGQGQEGQVKPGAPSAAKAAPAPSSASQPAKSSESKLSLAKPSSPTAPGPATLPGATSPATPDRIRRIQIQKKGIQVTFPDKIHTDLFALRARFWGTRDGGPEKSAQLGADLKRVADAFGFKGQAETVQASEAYRNRIVELAKQAIKDGKTQFDAPKQETKPAAPAAPKASKELVLWGQNPKHGERWLKLSSNTSNAEMARWKKDGWKVVRQEKGADPNAPAAGAAEKAAVDEGAAFLAKHGLKEGMAVEFQLTAGGKIYSGTLTGPAGDNKVEVRIGKGPLKGQKRILDPLKNNVTAPTSVTRAKERLDELAALPPEQRADVKAMAADFNRLISTDDEFWQPTEKELSHPSEKVRAIEAGNSRRKATEKAFEAIGMKGENARSPVALAKAYPLLLEYIVQREETAAGKSDAAFQRLAQKPIAGHETESVGKLTEGSKFKYRGESFEVVSVNPDGTVTVKDGRKCGVKDLQDDETFQYESGTLEIQEASTEFAPPDEAKPAKPETVVPPAETKSPVGETKPAKAIGDAKTAERLRKLADGLTATIENRRRPMTQNPTPKRNREYRGRLHDADNYERTQQALRTLADAHESGTVPKVLADVKTKDEVHTLVRKGTLGGGYYDVIPDPKYADTSAKGKALQALLEAKPETPEEKAIREQREQAQKINVLEERLRFADIPGFFPTPKPLATEMVRRLDLKPGQSVLEPSAGKGDLADAVKESEPTAKITVVEPYATMREILTLKGYAIPQGSGGLDVMAHEGAQYDRIVMNPPFEKGADADHVRKAYDLLKPGGKLVALMSEGTFSRSDKKATAFQDWLESVGGVSEKAEAGAFKGVQAFRQTGVASRIVEIEKPEAKPVFQFKPGDRVSLTGGDRRHDDITGIIYNVQNDGAVLDIIKDGTDFPVRVTVEDYKKLEAAKPVIVPPAPKKPAAQQRPLTKSEQKEFEKLTLIAKAWRESGGPQLTTEQFKRYQELEALAGAQELLAEPKGANEAAELGEIARLRAKADELERQANNTLLRAYASKVKEVRGTLLKNANDAKKEAESIRAEANRREYAILGDKGKKDTLSLEAEAEKPAAAPAAPPEADLFAAPTETVSRGPSQLERFQGIVKLAADAPDKLRASDVDRVMSDVSPDEVEAFREWLLSKALQNETIAAVANWKPEPPKPLVSASQADALRKRIAENLKRKQGQGSLPEKLPKKSAEEIAADQRLFNDSVQLGAFYIQTGFHKFPEWSDRMLSDFGPTIESHLKSIYETAKITIESPGGEGAQGRVAGLQPGIRPPSERIVTARAEFTHPADESVLPSELVESLDPHQRQGAATAINSMEKFGGMLIADGTGCGKTRECIAVAHYYAKKGFKVVIVTKSETIKQDWKKKVFGGSYAFDSKAMGVKIRLAQDGVVKPGEIGITTYQNLSQVERASDSNTVLVFDESHALKNESQQARFGIGAVRRAAKVLFMSATPADKPEHIYYLAPLGIMEGKSVQQALSDLGMTLVTMRKRVKENGTFVEREITFWTEDQNVSDQERHARFSALFDRMTEKGVVIKREISMDGVRVQVLRLSLPPEAHDTMALELTTAARAWHMPGDSTIDDYDGLRKAIVLGNQRRQQEPFKIASAVMLAKRELEAGRQVVIFVSRVNESESGYNERVKNWAGEIEVVRHVATRSEGTAKTLAEALHEAGIHDIAEIHGNADQDSLEAMADFQAGRKRVVIATIESGGTGINLDDTVGNRPRSMIVVTAPFDAVGNIQAAGRVWRLKTLSGANLYYLFGDTEVDDWNAGVIGRKMSMVGAVVEGQVRRLDISDPELVTTDDFHSEMRSAPRDRKPANQIEEELPGGPPPVLDWKPFKTKAGKDKFVAPATPAFWDWYNANGKGENPLGLRPSKWQNEWQVWTDKVPSQASLGGPAAPVFYSRLVRTVEQSQQGKASGAQWKALIRNSKLGANLEEMLLVGVNDLEDGKVYTKAEVLDYLKANEVVVKDVTLGKGLTPAEEARFQKLADDYSADKFGVDSPLHDELSELQRKRNLPEGTTHFSQYQLPGAVEGSYREVLLTVPRDDRYKIVEHLGEPGMNEPSFYTVQNLVTGKESNPFDTREQAENLLAEKGTGTVQWNDGHAQYSEVANPIVRLRFNERTTADGKRMLFLEEVQAPQKGEFEKMPALFQKNWREIAFKWAIRHAAENGFDSVGWTTGEQQAARYDLSKHVDSIEVAKNADDVSWHVLGMKGNTSVVGKRFASLDELDAVIGKDLANKAREDLAKMPASSQDRSIKDHYDGVKYSGVDLKIGGGGLSKLYDVDFRNVVNNLPAVKKAGQKVGTAAIRSEYKRTFYGRDITAEEFKNRVNEVATAWEERRSPEAWQRWNVTLDHQAESVAKAMDEGQPYSVAMQEHGTNGLLTALGLDGRLGDDLRASNVHSLDLTPAIRESVMSGQPLAAMAPGAATTQGRAPVEAKSVSELLSLLDAGKTGLSPKQAEFLRALLDNPKLAAALDGIRFHVTDALANGWNGSFFDNLVTVVAGKDPVIAIEEVLHAVLLTLPQPMQTELERLRVQSINNVLEAEKAGDNPDPVKIAALENLRDKPTAGANDFLSRNFPDSFRNEIYPYSNWQEYGAQTASKRFAKKAGSTVEGFWQQLKDIIRGFIRALRNLFRSNGREQDIFDDILAGNFELEPKSRQPVQSAQASLGEAQPATPQPPAAVPEFDVADWQAEMQRELAEEEGVVTRVMGRKDTVEDRARLNRANGTVYANNLFAEVGLPVVEAPGGFWRLADEQKPQEAAGQALLARLNELKLDQESPVFQSPMGGGGSLLNSIRVYLTADSVTAFSKDLKRQLYKASQEEASHRGLMLAALRGGKQSVEYVARHVDVVLSEQYRTEHGDPAIDTVVKGALEDFKAWFTDEELENALKSAPAFADLLKRLTGDNAIEFLRRVFELPFSQRADLRKHAEELAVETLNVSPEQAKTLGQAFENAFDTMFDRATTHALTVIERMLSARERQRLRVGKRRGVWQAIVSAVKAGRFDSDYIIARIAQSVGGYALPTEAEIATVRDLAERLDKLRTPPASLLKGATTDAERARRRREFRDSTSKRQVEFQRKIGTYWAKWTKPFTLRNKQGRRNIIEAMYEFTAGNLLAKAGFLTRQSIDVSTYAVIHIPFRAMANAMVQHGGFIHGAPTAEFWKDFDNILRESVEGQVKSLKAGATEFREALRGTAEIKNVDRLLSGIALFERAQNYATELAQKGRHVEAFIYRLFAAMRFGYRFASGWDNLQGTGQEWQEMRTQAYRAFLDQGMNSAEAKLAVERLLPDQKAATLKAVEKARRNYEMAEPGMVPTQAEIMAGAYHMLKGIFYEDMRAAGMPADELEAKIRLMRSANAWNESMTGVVSPGGIMSSLMKGFGELGKNVPLIGVLAGSFGRFGNAIGLGVDRALMGTPLGQFPGVFGVKPEYVDPATGMASRGNPMMRSPEDRAQRRVESAVFTSFGILAMLLVFGGYLIVRQRWPRDKRERELWEANGWRPGTVALQLGDGQEMPFSTTVGPFAPLRPYLAAAGAMKDVADRRAKQQAALDEKAARLGIPAGKLAPIGAADLMAVGLETAWAAAMGGRTAAGLIGSITDYGLPNAEKMVSGAISPYVPGLPALQEISRMAGVRLDEKLATIGDFMLPLPTSGAAQVNMLGDPVGGPNDLQRMVQVLTGGTYPGITDADALKQRTGYAALFATEYRPPAVDPSRGYAFSDGFRPMNPPELARYTAARGQAFKEELQGVSVDGLDEATGKKAVQAAFQRANTRALEAVGAAPPASSRASGAVSGAPSRSEAVYDAGMPSIRSSAMPQGGARVPGLRRASFRASRRLGIRRGPSLRRGRSLTRRLKGPSLRRASVRGIRFPTVRRRRGRSIRLPRLA